MVKVKKINKPAVIFLIYIRNFRAYTYIICELVSFNCIEYLKRSGNLSRIVIIKYIKVFIPGNTNSEDLELYD